MLRSWIPVALMHCLLIAGFCPAASAPPAAADAITETAVSVPMRDGVRLATDVVRPKADGKYPAVLIRTPYKRNTGPGPALARQGYALVCQDVRGRHASEDEFHPFASEAADGYDTVEWIASQPWCDGNVGMTGGSYLGFTQLAAALAKAPHLRCITPAVPPADFDEGTIFLGGCLRQELVLGWLMGQAWASQRVLSKQVSSEELARWQPDRDFGRWCRHLPLADPGPISVGGDSYARSWRDIIGGWEKPQTWDNQSADRHPEQIQVPVLIQAGFFDIFADEDLRLLSALRQRGGSDLARQHSHLLIGPWTHGLGGAAGEVDFRAARSALAGLDARWLARWLKGQAGGVEAWPAIHYFVMNQDRWLDTDVWPPAKSVAARFYLDGKTLSRNLPAGQQEAAAFRYDPANPVPTLGGNNLTVASGIHDHRSHAARADVLSFLAEPLAEDLTVAGPIQAHLFVSSNAPDTDFTAMLLDVRPDGYRANVRDGIVRLRYRNGRDKPQLLKASEIVEAQIELGSTAWCFKAGHRLALHVSSSNFPRYDRSLNSAEPPMSWTKPAVAENRVHHDAEHASYVELPLLP